MKLELNKVLDSVWKMISNMPLLQVFKDLKF